MKRFRRPNPSRVWPPVYHPSTQPISLSGTPMARNASRAPPRINAAARGTREGRRGHPKPTGRESSDVFWTVVASLVGRRRALALSKASVA